jgi:hypothetical protein
VSDSRIFPVFLAKNGYYKGTLLYYYKVTLEVLAMFRWSAFGHTGFGFKVTEAGK